MSSRELTIEILSRLNAASKSRRWIVVAVQACLIPAACIWAFLLRFDFRLPALYAPHVLFALGTWGVVKLAAFMALGLTNRWWRYFSMPDLFRLAIANVGGSILGTAIIAAFGPAGFPRSVYILDFLLCSLFTAAAPAAARATMEVFRARINVPGEIRTLIYGAGDAGISLLREIRQNPALPYKVVGFADDNPEKRGVSFLGASVLGAGEDLVRIAQRKSVGMVLVAIPTASGADMTRILRHCQEAGVQYKTVPGMAEVMEERGLLRQIRDVSVEDLLGRNAVSLDTAALRARFAGQVVMVTGAAGSIGSEICRQIARFQPAAIVGYEIAESALFHIEQEMARTFPGIPFHPEIGSIQNPRRLTEVLERHNPSIVYHAAAYKHVPMMEAHIFEAVENNVFGTLNVALAAAGNGVEDFVMISSDKAVRPTNIMGATKRMAELVIRSLQNGGVKYVSVRFGNVLGSNGSVVPTFKEQIARGGPVTVTHPEMRRYFMTIPEACQLVLQSSTMGNGGEIFVLDMGEPVKIVDLARNLILLSGLRPDEDIKIEFIGVRPGEKLYEELSLSDESTLPTRYEQIKIFAGNSLSGEAMESYLETLRDITARRDLPALVLLLKEIITDYNPSADVLRRAMEPARQSLGVVK